LGAGALFFLAVAAFAKPVAAAPAQAVPSPTPAPAKAKPAPAQVFIIGDILPVGIVDDQFAHGFSQQFSGGIRVGASVPVLGQRLMFEWQYQDIGYNHAAGDVGIVGGGHGYVGAFVNHQYTLEERAGVQLGKTPINAAFAVFYHPNRAGLPVLVGGGLGLEALPDAHKKQSLFGKLYYYPYVTNELPYTLAAQGPNLPPPAGPPLQYSYVRYELGIAHRLGRLGPANTLLSASITGDHATGVVNAPSNVNIISLDIGLGVGF
jgi:hypothetical protein